MTCLKHLLFCNLVSILSRALVIHFNFTICFRQPRSIESRKRRNKMKKVKRKLKIEQLKRNKEAERQAQESQIMNLERRNALLSRALKEDKTRFSRVCTPVPYQNSLSLSILNQHRNKTYNINRKLKSTITKFRASDIVSTDEIAAGVFGTVYTGYIVSLQQPIAIKKLNSAEENILAEAKLASEMNGNVNFPFIFSLAETNVILMELIKNMDGLTSPTLSDLFPENITGEEFIDIAVQLVKGVHSLHCKGITHNDLHTRNLIIRDRRYLKIIDMGKASLIDDPVKHNISGSNQ